MTLADDAVKFNKWNSVKLAWHKIMVLGKLGICVSMLALDCSCFHFMLEPELKYLKRVNKIYRLLAYINIKN